MKVAVGDAVVDPMDGSLRKVVRIDRETLYMADGGVEDAVVSRDTTVPTPVQVAAVRGIRNPYKEFHATMRFSAAVAEYIRRAPTLFTTDPLGSLVENHGNPYGASFWNGFHGIGRNVFTVNGYHRAGLTIAKALAAVSS